MNFIDELLSKHLSGMDFLGEISVHIYDHGEVREQLANYPQFVSDAIAIIDFDTDMMMDGDIFENDSDKAPAIMTAFRNCGMEDDANTIQSLSDLFEDDEDAFWSDEGEQLYSKLMWKTDNQLFWEYVKKYMDSVVSLI